MHWNLRPPKPCQPFLALNTMPCQVWSRWTYPLPYYSVFAADTLIHAVILTSDPVTLNVAAYRLWHDETLYQIWMQSNNLLRRYCEFSVWSHDLEHCMTCCAPSARLWDNFHEVWPSTTYLCLNYSVFDADMLRHAITLTFDLLTLNFYSTSGVIRLNSVQNLSEIE